MLKRASHIAAFLSILACSSPNGEHRPIDAPASDNAELDSLIDAASAQERGDSYLSYVLADSAFRIADRSNDIPRRAKAGSVLLYAAVQLDSIAAFDRWEPVVALLYESTRDKEALARHFRRMGDSHYRKGHGVKAKDYYTRSLDMARAAFAGGELAETLSSLGSLELETGAPSDAIILQRRALSVLDSIGLDSVPRMRALGNLALAMAWAEFPDSAIHYHNEAIALIGPTGDPRLLAWNLLNLGTAYIDKGLYSAALHYLQQAHDLHAKAGMPYELAASIYYMAYCHEQVSPPEEVIQAYSRVIAIYDSLSMPHRSSNGHAALGRFLVDLDSTRCAESGLDPNDRNTMALAHLRSALAVCRTLDYPNQLADILDGLSDVERTNGELDSAMVHAIQAIQIRERLNSPGRAAGSYKDLGMALHAKGRMREAERAFLTGLERNKVTPNLQNEVALHNAIQSLYADMGRPAEAYKHLKLARSLNESMLSETKRKEIVQRDLQWNFDREQLTDSLAAAQQLKEEEDRRVIAELRSGRAELLSLAIAGGSTLLLGGGILLFVFDRRQRRERFAKEAARLETKALRSQMDPHFIGNTLHAVNGYLLTNDPETASSLLSRFSKWIRSTLESSRHDEVPLLDDIEAMRTYLALEQLRTRNKFEFTIELPPKESMFGLRIPPLLVQPILENAIRHGVMPKEGTGHIRLMVLDKEDHLIIVVEDDGVGRAAEARPNTEDKSSLSTRITRERLKLLSERSGQRSEMRVIDLPQGTRVEIVLPMPTS